MPVVVFFLCPPSHSGKKALHPSGPNYLPRILSKIITHSAEISTREPLWGARTSQHLSIGRHFCLVSVVFFFFLELRTEPRTLHFPGKCFTTEPNSQPFSVSFYHSLDFISVFSSIPLSLEHCLAEILHVRMVETRVLLSAWLIAIRFRIEESLDSLQRSQCVISLDLYSTFMEWVRSGSHLIDEAAITQG